MTMQSTQPLALSAHTLVGDKVLNHDNEEIGKVEEIMIDILTGRVAYVVVSFGGILGIGSKLFAVPWSVLRVNHDEACVILDIPREQLEAAPGFDRDRWPSITDPVWRDEVDAYYRAPRRQR